MDDDDWWGNIELEQPPSLSYGTRYEVDCIKYEIRQIEKRGILRAGAGRLKELRAQLDRIQQGCPHIWEVFTLFTHVRQFCVKCDKENRDYKHY